MPSRRSAPSRCAGQTPRARPTARAPARIRPARRPIHPLGDRGPGVAAADSRAASPIRRRRAAESWLSACSSSPSRCRVGGRDQDAVDAVVDDVRVAGDAGGEHRGAGRERLGQDHAEALAGQRRSAEQVRLVEAPPQLLLGDPATGVDVRLDLGVGEVAPDLVGLDPDHGQPRGHVLDQRLEGGEEHRQALALLRSADEQDLEPVRGRLRHGGQALVSTPFGITS